MKKLLALLLSMMMAVSLTVPAFAAETGEAPADGGPSFRLENGEPAPIYTPGDAIPINAFLPEADNDFTMGVIGGADGPTSIITSIPGLEDFNWDGYDLEDLDNIDWEELNGLMQQYEQQLIDSTKEALGGVPGQVGVMVNNAYVKFPDAAPEVTNGRTMVPVRALVETLGGEVSYDDGVVLFVLDEWAYEFELGSTTVTVVAYDSGVDTPKGTIEMDCAPYLKAGRTYVPIRFISEALGYEVGWDSAFQTAILLDREALAAKFDEKFTIMNRVQANQSPALKDGESWSADVKGNVTVTAFDTLNGNKTYKADFTSEALMNTEAVNGSYSFKLSNNIVDALVELMNQWNYEELTEDEESALRNTIEGLKEFEVILNKEGLAWVHAPILDELGGEKNIWCGVDMGLEYAEALFARTDASTVGTVLAAMMSTDSVVDYSNTVGMTAQMMYELYGDDKFTTSGGVSTCTIGVDELMALYENMGLGSAVNQLKDVFKEYSIVMKVDSKGGVTVTCKLETAADVQAGMPGMKMTMDATQSGGKATVTMDLHVANFGEVKLTMNSTQKAVSDKPAAEPPAGANIVDAPELLNGYGE